MLCRAFALVAGGLYLVGLFVVNLDIGRYGVSRPGLNQAEYLVSGALWAAPVVTCFGLLDHAFRFMGRPHQSAPNGIRLGLWLLSTLGIAPLAAVAVLAGFPLGDGAGPADVALGWLGVVAGAGALAIASRRLSGEQPGVSRGNPVSAWCWAGLLLLSSIALWALVVVPHVSPVVGGGRRPLVDLILTPAASTMAPELPLPLSADGRRVGPVALLSNDGRTVFVGRLSTRPSSLRSSLKRERAVGIDSRNIEAIVFLTSREARRD